MENHTLAETLADMADLLRPAAIRAAATLKVADHIAAGAADPGELARRCGARPDLMDILLRYLASLGVLQPEADGRYGVAELGAPLLSDHPTSLRDHLSMTGMVGRGDAAMVNLVHTLRTGEPAHAVPLEKGYWESVNNDPEFAGSLMRNFSENLVFDGEIVVHGYDWSGARDVVDVGGNSGAMLINLLRRHPHLRGTLLDLKNSAELASKNFADAGLGDRCTAVVGSFFDPLPAGRDVYLLSAILADWTDEQAVAILRRCAEAAGPSGKVLLAEVNLDVRGGGLAGARTELMLRALMPAPVRTVPELVALAQQAGLRLTWQGAGTPFRSLLEFSG
ncbi:hypothetical protein HNP84_009051 [Thermocatellispora tengchongensis]|uniref:Methyltransferase n=1 Tax=Thermocatellispora tengchongensis TaxID=1073253 RepID=A0A840PIB5_9ACTN|nr:methyltransferase [Thermocatellispora tengchongensis]MBB5139288.1 hypothetical protein [Thermocatellispora tengchongensis]